MNTVTVEISTPEGVFFAGPSSAVDLHSIDADIHIEPSGESYLTLLRLTEITIRRGSEFLSFVLENATASLRAGQLVVLAENIRPTVQENRGLPHADTWNLGQACIGLNATTYDNPQSP